MSVTSSTRSALSSSGLVGGILRSMPEESTTPNLVERVRATFEAVPDVEAVLGFFAADAVWEAIDLGTSFEGIAAIRGFLEDWFGSYEELRTEPEEIRELDGAVTFVLISQHGRLTGSPGFVQQRSAIVGLWQAALLVRVLVYPEVEEARAAAEAHAASRR
jgi:ketosteroid isomerase-like protein